MHLSSQKILLTGAILLLAACTGPNEEDFKSDVPVSQPTSQELEVEAQSSSENETENQVKESAEPEAVELPSEINLNVPFYAQAPEGDWSLPWQEACEESSLVLAHAYATGQSPSLAEFKNQVLAMVDWQNETFGDYEHTTVDQTAQMLEEFLGFNNYQVLESPTIDQLKKELAAGHVIVAPFAGRQLGNPFYSGEGPRYHMLVVRGYDEANFITNDVGTRRGENFIYPHEKFMNALHDWHDSDMSLGGKKVIVLKSQEE